ncbi:hypothetical protein RRG08_007977 [Elysia crispata]|uniref:Uncharacterized protein n=1 Tax=Elysia crispata TaxID=231223 RepID=A0AAE1DKU4_9GAST|nr:hypothetical protein RRG08_007977 [Elysia crispata]
MGGEGGGEYRQSQSHCCLRSREGGRRAGAESPQAWAVASLRSRSPWQRKRNKGIHGPGACGIAQIRVSRAGGSHAEEGAFLPS